MKSISLILSIFVAVILVGCSNSYSPLAPKQNATKVPLVLDMVDAPGSISSVEAVLTRQGFDTITVFLTISGDSASGTINQIATGTWNLTVNAVDDSSHVVYSGQTAVDVLPGGISNVKLTLDPATGSINISVGWGPSAAGDALSLDGQTGYFEAPNSPSLSSIDTAVTLEAWVKPQDQYYNTVIAKGSYDLLLEFAGGLYPGIILNGTVLDTTAPNYWGRLVVSKSVPAGTWTHVAVTYSQSTGLKVYYGSELVFQGPGTGQINAGADPLRIGARVDPVYTEYFHGGIDGVRIWDVVRTQSEIAENMNKELTGTENGLVAYYKFDEQPGSVVIHDATANHNDGRLYGGATLVPSTAF